MSDTGTTLVITDSLTLDPHAFQLVQDMCFAPRSRLHHERGGLRLSADDWEGPHM